MSSVGTKARQMKQKGLGMVQVVQLCDPGWSHDLLDLPETLQVQLHAGATLGPAWPRPAPNRHPLPTSAAAHELLLGKLLVPLRALKPFPTLWGD